MQIIHDDVSKLSDYGIVKDIHDIQFEALRSSFSLTIIVIKQQEMWGYFNKIPI